MIRIISAYFMTTSINTTMKFAYAWHGYNILHHTTINHLRASVWDHTPPTDVWRNIQWHHIAREVHRSYRGWPVTYVGEQLLHNSWYILQEHYVYMYSLLVIYIMNWRFHDYKPSHTTDDMEWCKTQPCFALERVTGLCTVAESTHSHLHVYQQKVRYLKLLHVHTWTHTTSLVFTMSLGHHYEGRGQT